MPVPNSPRDTVVSEALRILRGLGFDNACEKDVLLFGSENPVASPLPQKYGIDKGCPEIYNIWKQPLEARSPLFRGVRCERGYIEFELDESGLEELVHECEQQHPFSGVPAEWLVVGRNAEYIHARLLHAAAIAEPGAQLPSAPLALRALWQCMMAASAAQRSVALDTTALALDEHRVNNTFRAGILSIMAALVLDWF